MLELSYNSLCQDELFALGRLNFSFYIFRKNINLIMEKIGFRLPLLVAIGLYLGSMVLPIYSGNTLPGYMALLGGWTVGLNDIPTAIAWFANVSFFFGVVMILKRKNPRPFAALVLSIITVVLGLTVLAAGKTITGTSDFLSKAPMGTGFYVWIASFIVLLFASYIKFKKR